MPQMHKGERVYTPTRLHRDLSALLRQESQRRHVPVGDLVAAAVAHQFGRADLAPPNTAPAEELPLT
jgi:hypothetical protein